MSSSAQKLAWILLGSKGGDNAQLRVLAKACGFQLREIALDFTEQYRRTNVRLGATLDTLTDEARQRLMPPWPDVVCSSGRRSVPVARWIKQQCGAKLVHIGRPWGHLRWFDLVLAMPQYRVRNRSNVFQARMPFNALDPVALEAAAARWREDFSRFQRPWIAVLLGGASVPLTMDAATAATIAKQASQHATSQGGSVLALTSPRTSAEARDAFFAALTAPGLRHAWRPNDADSPYLGALALADQFIVSGDSASMLAEAVRRNRPVHVARLPMLLRKKRKRSEFLRGILPSALYESLADWNLVKPNRAMDQLHQRLAADGLIRFLGDPVFAPPPFEDDIAAAAARIQALV
jgi:mitochondrial fission protein ELM1